TSSASYRARAMEQLQASMWQRGGRRQLWPPAVSGCWLHSAGQWATDASLLKYSGNGATRTRCS
ncbi:unnamed protein product, partial [Symbiodinium pilosum]